MHKHLAPAACCQGLWQEKSWSRHIPGLQPLTPRRGNRCLQRKRQPSGGPHCDTVEAGRPPLSSLRVPTLHRGFEDWRGPERSVSLPGEIPPLSPALLSALNCLSPSSRPSSSSWSAAQRSRCGRSRASLGGGDSLACHFLCAAPGLLAGSGVCLLGWGREPGLQAFHVGRGLPARDANLRLEPPKDSVWRKNARCL